MEIKDADVKSLSDFANSKKNYIYTKIDIPFYQRPYKWTDDQIKELFSDFFSTINIKDKKKKQVHYFIGSVIAYDETKDNTNLAEYEIIDGQQRLTTLFLMNYLRFLIGRRVIEYQLMNKKTNKVDSRYQELIGGYKLFLGTDDSDGRNIDKMDNFNSELERELDKTSPDTTKLLNDFRKVVGLPQMDEDNSDTYKTHHQYALNAFLSNEKLSLNYSRTQLNEKLKKAMSQIVFETSNYDLTFADDELAKAVKQNQPSDSSNQDATVIQYAKAIRIIFMEVNRIVDENFDKSDSLDRSIIALDVIDTMLNDLQVCLLTSSNESDAYTLFEVLNDRGLEIDDLELMKDLFLKEYWSSAINPNHPDADRDNHIDQLDDLWDEIFDLNISESERSLISYLGTIYLTGNKTETLKNNKTHFRKLINEEVFNNKGGSHSVQNYTYTKAVNDIQVFKMCKIILDEAEIKYSGALAGDVIAEQGDKSIVYKCINLLHAVKCDGVLPAVVNILINDFKYQKGLLNNDDQLININDFKDYIKNTYTSDSSNGSNGTIASDYVYSFCDQLKKLVLLSKDYNSPRNIAIKVISCCNKRSFDKNRLGSLIKLDNYVTEFNEWIKEWNYKKNTQQQHRVLITLLDLYRYYTVEEDNGDKYLKLNSNSNLTIQNKLSLDHLEPQTIDDSQKKNYFCVGSPEKRKKIIDGIGNMMVLDCPTNSRKRNIPLESALNTNYSTMHPSFLIDDAKKLLDQYHTDGGKVSKNVGETKKYKVPKEEFFTKRSELLINYFTKYLTSSYRQQQIEL